MLGACEASRPLTKSVTLKDIARATGVHVSTVSRALDARLYTSLTQDVVERVRSTAKNMGYRPNRLASSLRTKRTMSIGVILPDITNAMFPPIVRGIESVLEPLGYTSIIVNTDNERDRERKLIGVLIERGVDGIIHAAPRVSAPEIAEIYEAGTPVVTTNRRVSDGNIPSVVNDDADGIRQLLTHLIEAGHKRIAHIAGPQTSSTGYARLKAFRQIARQRGIDSSAKVIRTATKFDEAEGQRCTRELLKADSRLTALLCANDRLALGAIQELSALGKSCPADISVTGFNDVQFLDMIPPGLTTIRVAQFDAGRISAELILRMINDKAETVPTTTVLPVRLISRGSVAKPRK